MKDLKSLFTTRELAPLELSKVHLWTPTYFMDLSQKNSLFSLRFPPFLVNLFILFRKVEAYLCHVEFGLYQRIWAVVF